MTHTPEFQSAHDAYLAGTDDLVGRMYAKANAACAESESAFEEYQAAYAASDGEQTDKLTLLHYLYTAASARFKCASAASHSVAEAAGTGAMAAGRAADKQRMKEEA